MPKSGGRERLVCRTIANNRCHQMTLSNLDSNTFNRLLSALPAMEWQRLEADLELVELARDRMLYEAGCPVREVYFPASAVVSLVSLLTDGAAPEVAVVGNEGVVGVCAFMGGGRALSSAVVETAGHAWRMSAEAISLHAQRAPEVMQPLLRYAQNLFAHLVQTSCCYRHHTLEQQVCRWLLLHVDRQAGNELTVTHQRIAWMLGVRREGVTGAAARLQKDGLIHCSRGHIVITDRSGLEGRSCECYSVIRQADDRLSIAPTYRPRASLALQLGAFP